MAWGAMSALRFVIGVYLCRLDRNKFLLYCRCLILLLGPKSVLSGRTVSVASTAVSVDAEYDTGDGGMGCCLRVCYGIMLAFPWGGNGA